MNHLTFVISITFKIKIDFFGKLYILYKNIQKHYYTIRVEPDTRLKRVSGTDKALLPSTSIIRVIRVNICARIE